MTTDEKKLLLKDLLHRADCDVLVQFTLKYGDNGHKEGVYLARISSISSDGWIEVDYAEDGKTFDKCWSTSIDDIRPYLRRMSSMTFSEKTEYQRQKLNATVTGNPALPADYLDSIHVDYRNLIEAGCAVEVTKDNNPYNLTIEKDVLPENQEPGTGIEDLRERTDWFIVSTLHTDFEDGMQNAMTMFVSERSRLYRQAVLMWLREIWEKRDEFPAGFMWKFIRILASTYRKGEDDDLFETVACTALEHPDSSDTTESAIMLIEEVRSRACLDALTGVLEKIDFDWMKSYARKVRDELIEELGNDNQKDNI